MQRADSLAVLGNLSLLTSINFTSAIANLSLPTGFEPVFQAPEAHVLSKLYYGSFLS